MELPPVNKTSSLRALMSHNKKSPSLPRQKIVHSGWLWKKGLMNSPLANRRWFEIKGDQLYYFKTKGDENHLGQISLAGNQVRKVTGNSDGNKYSFELVAGEERKGRPVVDNFESLLFAASSPYELEEWVKAINRIIYTPIGGGMFGRSIRETVKIESHRGGGMVPIIVEQCVEYIRKHGLNEEGIFRIPGAKDQVEQLKNEFNKGILKELKDGEYKVSIVASVLKQYLGDLPQSVIPPENYGQFIAVGGLYKVDPDIAFQKFEVLLQDIPQAHFDLLKYLCRFLYELQSHHEMTKMTVENLALVFGPNILRPEIEEDPTMLLKCLSEATTTTVALISNHAKLFPVTNDERSYNPPSSPEDSLIDLEFESFTSLQPQLPKASSSVDHKFESIPSVTLTEPLSADKRSLSESSLVDIIIENERTKSISNSPTYKDEVINLRQEMVSQRKNFEEQISELEKKLDVEKKVQAMLKMRLVDEQKARQAVEERLELYRAGIEEYCRKFGHVDISIP